MDKRRVAIKCFVFAANQFGRGGMVRRQAWMLRGLRLWNEATGEDVSASVAEVLAWTIPGRFPQAVPLVSMARWVLSHSEQAARELKGE